jgi:hypothetical protein
MEMVCSAAKGCNHTTKTNSLTIIKLLEAATTNYPNLFHRIWFFYIHYYVNSSIDPFASFDCI